MPDIAIKFDNISKRYEKGSSTIRESIAKLFRGSKDQNYLTHENPASRSNAFWALKDVNFEVKKGNTLGIIGPNGAGKSTILKLLAGITEPTTGKITINGKIGVLIELGAGFHPEFTGRENIYLNGAIMGMSKKEINEKFAAIVDFAELQEFIDTPVKHYSSGMYVRLGFSIAAHLEPDILLIDEVLAVGDARFVQKCLRKLEEFKEKRVTTIFVSHDMNSIKKNCRQVILLDKGEIIDAGEPKEIVDVYNALTFEKIASDIKGEKSFSSKEIASRRVSGKSQQYGSLQAEIIDVTIIKDNGICSEVINSGESTEIKITALFYEDISDILVGITIRNRIGVDVYMTNTGWKGVEIPKVQKNTKLEVTFAQKMSLVPGEYTITAAVSQSTPNGIKRLDWVSDYLSFEVFASEKMSGICNLDSRVSVKTADK
ncbi:MAG: hypothetical protein A2149_02980 [Candidatus Schekmanbacteria bacterium RBG_16_38_11]|uniref:ABC transporter domain-containing protein n=1 Tax=Candidatus Schekmanbacteria bacterium RBG_16_38_11 TaxID=1817880 RepID=A0A1F7RR46_9BACT|nr:MAG: hypothetical protein A2149_02980 [Candidatus Schekmanbacteria bacterium RBG_16_38_11]